MGDGTFTMTQFPQRDEGTHEHSQADGPITVVADDTDNQPAEGAAELAAQVVTAADDVEGQPTGETEGSGPVTIEADWPKPITEADNKAAPARKPVSKKTTKG